MGSIPELVLEGIEKVGSEYDFAVLLGKRALQIQSGLTPFSGAGKGSLGMAVEEIVEGKVQIKPKEEEPQVE